MILILASHEDDHTQAVLEHLDRLGAQATVLDLSRFPRELQLSLWYCQNGQRDFRLALPGGEELSLSHCRVAWWRRPQPIELHPEIVSPSHRTFAYNECFETLAGLWPTLDAFWINQPTRDEIASHKVYQLRVAREIGLPTPVTLITNNPAQARAFVDRYGSERTIYKTFSATQEEWRETRLMQPEEVALLDNVRFAPVIFQEYVPACLDLRVTVVGDEIFASAVHSQETGYKVDYRMEMAAARIEPYGLPAGVVAGLRQLMERLGLVYGAIDLRLTPDGTYVFLEINPAGEWLFMEERSGQSISAAFARLLASHDR